MFSDIFVAHVATVEKPSCEIDTRYNKHKRQPEPHNLNYPHMFKSIKKKRLHQISATATDEQLPHLPELSNYERLSY